MCVGQEPSTLCAPTWRLARNQRYRRMLHLLYCLHLLLKTIMHNAQKLVRVSYNSKVFKVVKDHVCLGVNVFSNKWFAKYIKMVTFSKMRWKIKHRVSQSVGFPIHHSNMELLCVCMCVHLSMSEGNCSLLLQMSLSQTYKCAFPIH